VFAFFLVGAATDLVVRTRLKSGAAMLLGLVFLLPSLALLVSAQAARSMLLLIAGTLIGGIATALAYFGSLQVVNQIAPEDQRSEVVSTYMIFCYLGNSVPVIGIGLLSGIATSMTAHLIFAIVVAALAVIGLVTGVKYAPKQTAQAAAGEEPRREGRLKAS
jgi:MFS family permease